MVSTKSAQRNPGMIDTCQERFFYQRTRGPGDAVIPRGLGRCSERAGTASTVVNGLGIVTLNEDDSVVRALGESF